MKSDQTIFGNSLVLNYKKKIISKSFSKIDPVDPVLP